MLNWEVVLKKDLNGGYWFNKEWFIKLSILILEWVVYIMCMLLMDIYLEKSMIFLCKIVFLCVFRSR